MPSGQFSGGLIQPGQTASPQQWEQIVNDLAAARVATSGWEQKKMDAQIKDAMEGRENAYKIASLQAETSRYGTDAARETAMAQLKENARQFEMTHKLDIAKTATEYLSTPDRYFQAADFLGMTNRAAQGAGPRPYGYYGAPTPKTMQDFNALYGGDAQTDGSPQRMPAAGGGGIYGGSGASGGGGAQPSAAASGGGQTQTDPRQAAVQQVFKNLPPSEGQGLDDMDFAALTAAQAIYNTNLRPGTLERMRPGQQAMLGSAGRRLGYDVKDWQAQYNRNRPGQQSVRAA